jgi:hypothetical protein
MAGATDYQGFATPSSHPPFPLGQRSPMLRLQVSELSHVMDFDVLLRATQLTCLSEQALNQFAASIPDGLRGLLIDASPFIRL